MTLKYTSTPNIEMKKIVRTITKVIMLIDIVMYNFRSIQYNLLK